MNIFFISHYSHLYGANRSLLTLIEYFHNHNHSIRVLLPSMGTMTEKLAEKGIPYDIIPYYSSFLYMKLTFKHLIVPILALLNILSFPIIFFKIRKFSPDLIYSNTSAENLGIIFAKLLKIKHISHIREFMSLDYGSYFIFGKNLKRRFISLSDGVIFVSKSVKTEILNGKHFTRNSVIYNGIASPFSNIIEKELPISPMFGLVGLLDPGKGQFKAVSYFSSILESFPDAELHIIGDNKSGKYKKQIERLIDNLNIKENVIFHGFIEDHNEIYEKFDILLMFSRSEGFGRVTVEAMLRGKPVIGYNNAGTSELIKHEITGCLFENIETFNKSVKFIMASRTSFNKLRFNAFHHIRQLSNVKDYCTSVERFINQVVDTKK